MHQAASTSNHRIRVLPAFVMGHFRCVSLTNRSRKTSGRLLFNNVIKSVSEYISTATATSLGRPQPARKIALKVFGSSGWDKDAFLLPGVDLVFDAIYYANFPVVVLNLDTPSALLGFQLGGIVGHKFLSRYRVGIDLEKSVLSLKQTS